jgi:hypothetical protein
MKIELKLPQTSAAPISKENVLEEVLKYAAKDGDIYWHDSIEEYRYDTNYAQYRDIDKSKAVGKVTGAFIKGDFIYIECDVPDMKIYNTYLCVYRASSQVVGVVPNRYTEITEFYGIDLIKIDPASDYATKGSMIEN